MAARLTIRSAMAICFSAQGKHRQPGWHSQRRSRPVAKKCIVVILGEKNV